MINKKCLLILFIIQFISFTETTLKSSDNITPSEQIPKKEITKSKIETFIQKIKENPKKAIFLTALILFGISAPIYIFRDYIFKNYTPTIKLELTNKDLDEINKEKTRLQNILDNNFTRRTQLGNISPISGIVQIDYNFKNLHQRIKNALKEINKEIEQWASAVKEGTIPSPHIKDPTQKEVSANIKIQIVSVFHNPLESIEKTTEKVKESFQRLKSGLADIAANKQVSRTISEEEYDSSFPKLSTLQWQKILYDYYNEKFKEFKFERE